MIRARYPSLFCFRSVPMMCHCWPILAQNVPPTHHGPVTNGTEWNSRTEQVSPYKVLGLTDHSLRVRRTETTLTYRTRYTVHDGHKHRT